MELSCISIKGLHGTEVCVCKVWHDFQWLTVSIDIQRETLTLKGQPQHNAQ